MTFSIPIPGPEIQVNISVEPGSSVVFVGASGGGKTRLATYIEALFGIQAHRISAHRALTLNPGVAKINEKLALLTSR